MTSTTVPMRDFVTQHYENVRVVCKLGKAVVFSAMHNQQFWLLVLGVPVKMVTVCTYEDWKEWQDDMHVVRLAARDGGNGGPPDMGVTANLPPSPPSRPASNAHALPVSPDFGSHS